MKKQALSLLLILLSPAILSAQGLPSLRLMMADLGNRYDKSFVYESGLPLDRPYSGPELTGTNLRQDLRLLFQDSGLVWTMDGHYIVLRARRGYADLPDAAAAAAPVVYDTLPPSRIVTVPEEQSRRTRAVAGDLVQVNARDLSPALAFLGSPDLLRSLRTLPGVAEGSDLASGLFVRGGTGGDNLYLLDGVPLYQAEHFFGFFSTFSPDILDRTDFYKGAFPARFGGAASSVLDVKSRPGDFERYHGTFGVGLVDGRLQLEGPVGQGNTSFNLSLRRSWADLLLGPVLSLYGGADRDYSDSRYGFHDIHAQLTHRFSDRSLLAARFYGGGDDYDLRDASTSGAEALKTQSQWSNILGSLAWDYRFNSGLGLTLTPYFSRYRSMHQNTEMKTLDSAQEETQAELRSAIDDAGINAAFAWILSPVHTARFGANARFHHFSPEYTAESYDASKHLGEWGFTREERALSEPRSSGEGALYAEDEMLLFRCFRLNLGLRATGYWVDGTFRGWLEPRVGGDIPVGDAFSLHFSYAAMNQFVQRLRVQYTELPSVFWMPVTGAMEPLHSDQFTFGASAKLSDRITVGAEGWYKHMTHLYEYNGVYTNLPPFPSWSQRYSEGEGRSYGVETVFGYRSAKWDMDAAYTLSWSLRHFEEIYPDWYRDRNDSRHRLGLDATWRPADGWEVRASWLFHSGYRVGFPAAFLLEKGSQLRRATMVFGEPFNVKLPDYHRLDLGLSYRYRTRRNLLEIWSLGFYNAYCRMNPVTATLVFRSEEDRFVARARGIIPLLPSFSYTLKF